MCPKGAQEQLDDPSCICRRLECVDEQSPSLLLWSKYSTRLVGLRRSLASLLEWPNCMQMGQLSSVEHKASCPRTRAFRGGDGLMNASGSVSALLATRSQIRR